MMHSKKGVGVIKLLNAHTVKSKGGFLKVCLQRATQDADCVSLLKLASERGLSQKGTEIRSVYLDDHAHNGQRQDSSRVGRRPAVDVITSCGENTRAAISLCLID